MSQGQTVASSVFIVSAPLDLFSPDPTPLPDSGQGPALEPRYQTMPFFHCVVLNVERKHGLGWPVVFTGVSARTAAACSLTLMVGYWEEWFGAMGGLCPYPRPGP